MGISSIGDASMTLTQPVSLPGTAGGQSAATSATPGVDAGSPGAAGQAAPAASSPSSTQLQNAIAQLQAAMQPAPSGIEFAIDASSGKTVVKVVDTETGSLIRQIPSEEMLAIASSIDRIKSLMLPGKA